MTVADSFKKDPRLALVATAVTDFSSALSLPDTEENKIAAATRMALVSLAFDKLNAKLAVQKVLTN